MTCSRNPITVVKTVLARSGIALAAIALIALLAGTAGVAQAQPQTTDPSTKPDSHASRGPVPDLPPRVPPHGRQPRQLDTEDEATTARTDTYMTYRGGWTQTTPRIYIWFWGDWSSSGDPYSEANYLWRFYAGVGGSAWNQTQTQYGYNCGNGAIGCSAGVRIQNPTGQMKNYAYDRSSVPLHPTQADMENKARAAANYFGDRSVNAQYIIAMPTGHLDQRSINYGFCAWHNYTYANGSPISYTSMPYIADRGTTCGMNKVNAGTAGRLDGVSILAGHEYAESETDPFLNAWMDSDGAENADKCLQWGLSGYMGNIALSTGTFAVQRQFSNYHLQYYGVGCRFS
jgi:hypothetical protein